MEIRSVKVSNVSLSASEQDIKEFFLFSGEIESVELHGANERSQTAFVTFKEPQGAKMAVFLSGSTIVDQSVGIELAPDYTPSASAVASNNNKGDTESVVQKAEDVVSSMLAKGFVLGKDALGKAKAFDDKHQFTSTVGATVASFDQKIGLSEKFAAGTTIVNERMKEMDQRFGVSDRTKSAFTAAEQGVSNAGSALMKNRYMLTGATWVTGAFSRVAKVAGDVGEKTKGRVIGEENSNPVPEGYTQIHQS